VLLVFSSLVLWFAEPGANHAIGLALVAFAIGTVSVEIATVFNNAMMPTLVPPERLGRLSGAGWAMGYAGGLVSLVIVLGFLAATPSGKTYFGIDPLFGLDPMLHEGDRAAGPFSALWFIAFVWPLLLFTPDAPRRGRPMRESVGQGLVQLRSTLREARQRPDLVRFLAANMVYQDALVALFAFGGIYGAGVFGWTAVELGLFGILLTITGTIGALIGGRLDDRFGAKAVIVGAIVTLALVCLGVLSLGREHVLFGIATPARSPEGGLFATIPEQVFVALGLVIGAVAGPLQASSRTFLARLVPASEAGRYFGLLALSGKVTSFLAPLCVALATGFFETQAAAPAVLILFFAAGLMLIAGVRRV
jgi:UMF1 family MFS transporter